MGHKFVGKIFVGHTFLPDQAKILSISSDSIGVICVVAVFWQKTNFHLAILSLLIFFKTPRVFQCLRLFGLDLSFSDIVSLYKEEKMVCAGGGY